MVIYQYPHLTPSLQADDLRNMTLPARSLIQADMVVAVKQEDRRRHARISLDNGRLYLHTMQDQPPPHAAARIQVGHGYLSLPYPFNTRWMRRLYGGEYKYKI